MNLKKKLYTNQLINDIKMTKYEPYKRSRPDGRLNINPKQWKDPFGRYSMPPCEFIHRKKGLNGAMTLLPNIDKISKALKMDESYVLQYLQYDLGTDTIKKEITYIKGIYDWVTLQKSLDRLINTFKLCPSKTCEDVGTKLKVSGKKKRVEVIISCSACGKTSAIVSKRTADTKLCTYIIKNPPAKDNSLNIKKDKYPKKEDFEKVHESAGAEDDDIDEFSVDTSPEAVAKRAAAEGVGMVSGIVACAEQELSQSERLDLYYKFVTQSKPTTTSIITEATRLNCGNRVVLVLLEAFCIDNTEFYTSPCLVLNKHVDLLGHFLEDNHKAQFKFLDRLEKLCLTKQELVPKFLRILVNLYDNELIEEEVILKWNTRKSSDPVSIILREKVLSFIDFLEEEEVEDTDEDEEDEIVFASTNAVGPTSLAKTVEKEEEDDSFIDDM